MLVQHWREMTSLLDGETSAGRLRLTEAQVLEPLLMYYEYGQIRSGDDRSVTAPNSGRNLIGFQHLPFSIASLHYSSDPSCFSLCLNSSRASTGGL